MREKIIKVFGEVIKNVFGKRMKEKVTNILEKYYFYVYKNNLNKELLERFGDEAFYDDLCKVLLEDDNLNKLLKRCKDRELFDEKLEDEYIKHIMQGMSSNLYNELNVKQILKYIEETAFKSFNNLKSPENRMIKNFILKEGNDTRVFISKVKKDTEKILDCQDSVQKGLAQIGFVQEQILKNIGTNHIKNTPDDILEKISTYQIQPHTFGFVDENSRYDMISHVRNTYVERTEELEYLKKILRIEGEEKKFAIISGIGGAGKSELAKAYAYEQRFSYRKVFLLTCSEKSGELNLLSLLEKSDYLIDKESITRKTLEEVFCKFENDILIIIDNCNDLNTGILKILSKGVSGNAHIIFTTRSIVKGLEISEDRILRLDNFNQEQFAYSVFCRNYCALSEMNRERKWINEKQIESVKNICKMAAYNPLLISLIAIQTREYNRDIRRLEEGFAVGLKKANLSGAQFDYEIGNERTVRGDISELMKVVFEDILKHDFTVFQKQIVSLLALMPAEPVQIDFLCELLGDVYEEQAYINGAWRTLAKMNWIQLSNDKCISMHPLLAEVLISYGDDKAIIKGSALLDYCEHLIKNWLVMSEEQQKKEYFIAFLLWEKIKNIEVYSNINLAVAAILDKNAVCRYIDQINELSYFGEKGNCSVVFMRDSDYGCKFGILQINSLYESIFLDLSDRKREGRYFGFKYIRQDDRDGKDENEQIILLWLYCTELMKVFLPSMIMGVEVKKIYRDFARGNQKIESIVLPDGICDIGDYAFAGCASMVGKIEFPNSIEKIGEAAFLRCSGLVGDLHLPIKVQKIGERCFCDCLGLDGNLVLPITLTEIGASAFSLCENLSGKLKIPETINNIGPYAFYNCKKLIGDISIPNTMSVISAGSFCGCWGLEHIEFPKNLTRIEDNAFADCKNLRGNLKLPSDLEFIGERAFENCCNITGELHLPEKIEFLGNHAFEGCSFSGNLILPKTLKYLGESCFEWCSAIDGNLHIYASLKEIKRNTFGKCGFTGKLTLPDTITIIEENAFYGCSGLTGPLKLPKEIVKIGDGAFSKCYGFSGELSLPVSLQFVGNEAFKDCIGICGAIRISQKLKYWGEDVLRGCNQINEIILIDEEGGIANVETFVKAKKYGEAFSGEDDDWEWEYADFDIEANLWAFERTCRRNIQYFFDQKMNLRNTIEVVEPNSFRENKLLRGCITFTDSLREIGDNAFWGCTGIKGDLELPNSLDELGGHAFYNCTNLNGGIYFPIGLKIIREGTFQGCCSLQGPVKFPEVLEEIGSFAFADCKNLCGPLVFPKTIKKIKSFAFKGCQKIEGIIVIPENVDEVHKSAFSECKLKKIIFLNPNTQILGCITDNPFKGDVIISGKNNSTAQEYAKKYGCTFEPYKSKGRYEESN